jgi:hypothetical protein
VKLDDICTGEFGLKALNQIETAVGIKDCWLGPQRF